MATAAPDILLASRISLPQNPCIYYVLLKPVPSCSPVDSLEQARRLILSSKQSHLNLLQSVLTSVQIVEEPFIYLFRISEKSATADFPLEHFGSLEFEGLTVHECSSFEPPSASSLLPPLEIRQPLAHFYESLTSRITQDIVDASVQKPFLAQRHVKRFRNGFVMGQVPSSSNWEYSTITRSLLSCQLQVHFSYSPEGVPSHLVIHPVLQPTPFLDLCHGLPLPPGAPITLLPFGTPAYFLSNYNGPTTGLIRQFQTSLLGLGAGEWATSSTLSLFVIAWIQVENKQGEDKGLTIIYPTRLCLTCLPLSSSRPLLEYLPELPTPLQPSPQAAHANLFSRESKRPASTPIQAHSSRPVLVSSPTAESLFSFRALTLSSKDLGSVANEVGGYVDTVARERERERERLKREREQRAVSSSPKARMTVATPLAQAIEPSTPVVAAQPQAQRPVQSFYPSPPQSTPNVVETTDMKTSPPIFTTPLPELPAVNITLHEPPGATMPPAPPTPSERPYSSYSMNAPWPQASDNYLGMDLDNMDFGVGDLGLNFDMDMTTLDNPPPKTSAMSFIPNRNAAGANAGMEFEDAFTDDDFSFFDRPSRIPQYTDTQNQSLSTTDPLASQFLHSASNAVPSSPSTFGDLAVGHHLHIPQSSASQIWSPSAFMDDLTPRSLVDHTDSVPPELLPSSQGNTPESHSAPATPDVQLIFDADVDLAQVVANNSARIFDPIPFARQHTNSDGKYALGKFSQPSPPAGTGEVQPKSISLPSSPSRITASREWKVTYDSATDPRPRLVNKLIGVKRKIPPPTSVDQHPPSKRAFWSSVQAHWNDPPVDDELISNDNDSESEHEDDYCENESLPVSRPVTPPPPYLPLGPTLISTYFNHKDLLPLSVPLRPPGAAISALNLAHPSNPAASVPTPVSPAAHLGASTERSRSLEAAASAIASEVIENPVWAESWKANVVGVKYAGEIWPTDVKMVKILLEQLPQWQGVADMATIFGLEGAFPATFAKNMDPSQPLEAPMLSIGKGESLIQILPPALRFWEKLALSPKSGQKDITAVVLFEDDNHKQPLVQSWLNILMTVYQGKRYGSITPGVPSVDSPGGIVGTRFDSSFRKTFNMLLQCLPGPHTPSIVFLVLPMALMTLSSSTFRQILTLTKKAQSQDPFSTTLFQFIPEQHIYSEMGKSTRYDTSFDLLAASIYNKIQIPVDRFQSHHSPDPNYDLDKDICSMFVAPSFTLSRPNHNKVTLVRAPKASLDVIDRHTLLHVGYYLTSCGKWIIACCVDERGESHRIGVWLTQSPVDHEGDSVQSNELYAVKKIWSFAMEFAKQTDIEWRVVFSRLGVPSEREIDAWTLYLSHEITSHRDQPPLHHTIICVIPDAPWFYVTPQQTIDHNPRSQSSKSSSSKHTSLFSDISSTSFTVFARNRLPIPMPPSQSDLCISHSLIPDPSGTVSSLPSPAAQSSNAQPDPRSVFDSSNVTSSSHSLSIIPQLTSVLTHRSQDYSTQTTSAVMTQIHLLGTYHSASYTHSQSLPGSTSAVPPDEQLLADITRNFHELAVLSKLRWQLDRLGGHKGLPFHLSATDAIRTALDMDWDRLDASAADL